MVGECYPTRQNTQRYSYFDRLRTFVPGTPLEPDEMRITFLGSMIPPVRRAQQEMSVFVEVGWFIDENGVERPRDQFVFDCGSGVCANYGAMGIPFGRMDKVFLCHLHGDHMSDLSNIYCFGPSADRKSPLYVWGPSASNITYKDLNKVISGPYDDGLTTYCQMLRAAMRWHSESFSFQTTSYAGYSKPTDWGITIPDPVMDPRAPYDTRYQQADYVDSPCDGYALVPIELTWDQTGVAYDNTTTGVKITHFPVVHCRKASIGYKLEWTAPNGRVLTMIYTSDTKPETISIDQAKNGGKGVDVLIHEMIVPPEVWAMKNAGLPAPPPYGINPKWDAIVDQCQMVQNSSHTPQGAFGYLLSQIRPRPRLTVVTHFPVADDTVACAFNSVLAHCPDIGKLGERITWSFDLMVFRLSAKTNKILQLRAVVSDFGWSPKTEQPPNQNTPKYWTWKVDDNGNLILDEHGNPIPVGDPFAQIDMTNVIPATNADGTVNYRSDGY
ncbi:MAG: MBL fold metallo-hydrolase [bacterium]